MTTPSPAKNDDSLSGFFYALSAYLIWGFLPLYMKALAHVPPAEVLAHRILWSLPIALAVLLFRGRTADLKAAFRTPRMLAMGIATASLVSVNWGTFNLAFHGWTKPAERIVLAADAAGCPLEVPRHG